MGLRADELLGNQAAPHEFTLDTADGERIEAEAPYPNVDVVSAEVKPVKRLVYQTIVVSASKDDLPAEQVVIGRLVAELEGGSEIEIQRDALPLNAGEVDTSKCVACGGRILPGEAVIDESGAYHERCRF